jgi:hypothetical protein
MSDASAQKRLAETVACMNGHLVLGMPLQETEWCGKCGAATLTACPGCKEPIPALNSGESALPQYCAACSRPFPWTEHAVSAARSLIRELSTLDQYERDQLRRSVDHLTQETPQTPLAIARVKKTLDRIGGEHARALRELLLSVASDAVKERLRADL